MQNIIWQPHPKQAQALARTEFEVLYGGARGGGKSDAGIMRLLYDINHPKFRALVIRRNADDLRDWVDRAYMYYSQLGATRRSNPPEFVFPSGAIIRTGHLKDDNAYTKYQGHEYQLILIEELTQIDAEANYEKLMQSCRSSTPELKPQMWSTTNPAPGEPGHKWVMRRFIKVEVPGKTYIDPETELTRIFIPATLDDNPSLQRNDPLYAKRLESMKDIRLRKAWREGIWEDAEVEGAYYGKLMQQLRNDNHIRKVDHNPYGSVYTYWDLGMHDYTSIWFFQFSGDEIHVIDFYQNSGETLGFYCNYVLSKDYIYEEHFAPHDIDNRVYGDSAARKPRTQKDIAKEAGINFKVVPKTDINNGIEAVRYVLPYCYFDKERCEKGIEALESYRKERDEKNDVFKSYPVHDIHSHAADAFRYFAVTYKEMREHSSNSSRKERRIKQ